MGKSNSFRSGLLIGSAAATVLAFDTGVAMAQDANTTANANREIIVTARKRQESLQDVPVVVTALSSETLELNAVNEINMLTTLTPGLIIRSGGGQTSQGTISLRGIQTGPINLASDQAVALNIDGVQIESGMGVKTGLFDLEQIEVLKGPQALFFGKNSSGGVIAFTTADPTDELFLRARGGYEFNGRERFIDVTVAGPLSDTLGARLAVSYMNLDGFYKNLSPTAVTPRAPNGREWIARGTIKWEPSEDFDARVKVSYSDRSYDQYSYSQKLFCSAPPEAGGTTAECENDDRITQPAPVDLLDRYEGQDPYSESHMFIASMDMNYALSDNLTLSSTSGYVRFKQAHYDSVLPRADTDFFILPTNLNEILLEQIDKMRTVSQEIRLASDFDTPFNFMLGAYFDDRMVSADAKLQFGNTASPRNRQRVDSSAYSFFGQATYDILENLELAGGARYTNEKRKYRGVVLEPVGPFPAGTPLVPTNDRLREDNISPEVTLTFQPSDDVTLFAAYKQGFKSGSFDISSTSNIALLFAPREIRFDSETAEGFEVGFKTMLFDRQLRFNGAVYDYKYKGLQLNSFDPNTSATRVLNAGSATTKGAEIDAQFAPRAVEGLVVNAAVNYNKARYGSFITDCHQGQLVGGTCPIDARPPVGPESQDLAGKVLKIAPRWSATWGFVLQRPLAETMTYRIGSNFSYSSWFHSDERGDPLGRQDAFVTINANLGIAGANDRWAIDLLGINLTDKRFLTATNSQPLTCGCGFRQDFFGNSDRGRQIRLQLTLKN